MFGWNTVLMQAEYRRARMADAEHERLVRRATESACGDDVSMVDRLLARLGGLLVAWGSQLQARNVGVPGELAC